jgi:NIMA-interacting peptidyl-prolyl cis-trans isomerase 1
MAEALPHGWVEKISRKREGVKYYFHQASGETSWVKPKPRSEGSSGSLPEGWDEAQTADGKMYYKNHLTRTTQWNHPSSNVKRARAEESTELVRARHVLIKHNLSRNPKSWRSDKVISLSKAEAIEELDVLRRNLDAKTGDTLEAHFSKVAEARSDCSSGKPGRGGDLGPFGRGKMQPAFEKAAFALRVGELTGPLETDSGIHLILRVS